MSLNVLLLKSGDQPPSNAEASKTSDRYVDFLRQQSDGQQLTLALIKQINLLEFKFCNLERLQLRLADIFFNQFTQGRLACKSVVITSKQTVEAFDSAMFQGAHLRPEFQSLLTTGDHQNMEQQKLIVYCVGQATLDRFQTLLQRLVTSGHSLLSDRVVTKVTAAGSEAKHKQNSQELAKIILADFEAAAASMDIYELFAFYPCSAIRKDDLSEQFKKVQLKYEELFVYNTSPSASGVEELRQLVKEEQTDTAAAAATCLVFFSPSGVEAAFGEIGQAALNSGRLFHFISVGPSTTAKLKAFVQADRIREMSEPSPQALVQLLKTL